MGGHIRHKTEIGLSINEVRYSVEGNKQRKVGSINSIHQLTSNGSNNGGLVIGSNG